MLLNVIEASQVTQDLQAAPRFPRLWDAWEGLKWVLARSPGIGLPLSSMPPPWYLYRQDSMRVGDPTFTVAYSVDSPELTIRTVLIR